MGLYTWIDDWNTILRDVLFADEELKRLMKIPKGTGIIEFIDRYMIRAGYTSKILKDESVRIVYGDVRANQTDVSNVKRNEMSFDIYVKFEDLRNADTDRLKLRTQMIANRLTELLTCPHEDFDGHYLNGYRFRHAGDWDMGTRTIGYARYNVSFYYMKVY